jgi:hypothetical protein
MGAGVENELEDGWFERKAYLEKRAGAEKKEAKSVTGAGFESQTRLHLNIRLDKLERSQSQK